MDHKIHNDKTGSAEFSGDEKRLILIQASGPVVLTGGGRSGWSDMVKEETAYGKEFKKAILEPGDCVLLK